METNRNVKDTAPTPSVSSPQADIDVNTGKFEQLQKHHSLAMTIRHWCQHKENTLISLLYILLLFFFIYKFKSTPKL